MSLVVGKISVALLTYRLQPPTKWRTWLLGFLSVSSLLLALLVIIIFFAQCQPTSALWRPGTGTCWDQTKTNDWIVAAGSKSNKITVPFWWPLRLTIVERLLGAGGPCARSATNNLSIQSPDQLEKKSHPGDAPRTRSLRRSLCSNQDSPHTQKNNGSRHHMGHDLPDCVEHYRSKRDHLRRLPSHDQRPSQALL